MSRCLHDRRWDRIDWSSPRRRPYLRIRLKRGQSGLGIHATAVPDYDSARWQAAIRAIAILVDTQDEVGNAGRAVLGELAPDVVSGPEAHDLQQPSARGVAAMLERKIWKDERLCRRNGLRLADDVPVLGQPAEVTREPLLDLAVEPARLLRRKDGIPRCELELEAALCDLAPRARGS